MCPTKYGSLFYICGWQNYMKRKRRMQGLRRRRPRTRSERGRRWKNRRRGKHERNGRGSCDKNGRIASGWHGMSRTEMRSESENACRQVRAQRDGRVSTIPNGQTHNLMIGTPSGTPTSLIGTRSALLAMQEASSQARAPRQTLTVPSGTT